MPLTKASINVDVDLTSIENDIENLQTNDALQDTSINSLISDVSDISSELETLSESVIAIPSTIKTTAASGDYFIGIDSAGLLYKITKANLLAGLTSGGGDDGGGDSGGGTTLPASVVLYMKFNGSDGSSTFTDVKGNAITNYGSPVVDNSITLLEGGALSLTGSSYVRAASNVSYNPGSGDFSLSFFARFASLSAGAVINRYAGSSGSAFVIQTNGSGISAYLYQGTSSVLIGNASLSTSTVYYIGIKRVGGTASLWVNGSMIASTSITGAINDSISPLYIGAESDASFFGNFRIDELVFSVGTALDLSVVPTAPYS